MKIPQPVTLELSHGALAEKALDLPASAGVFSLQVNGRVTYLSTAPNLQRRASRTMEKLGRLPFDSEKASLTIQCWACATKLYASLLLYELAKTHFPDDYLQRLHLRMPWFVGLLTRDRFPRLIAANRIPAGCQPVIGPFGRRDQAHLYQEQVEGSFLLRRCTDELHPHPEHPGCIYGEMRQCLRPCQAAVDDARYISEATAVSSFLLESGKRSMRDLAKARDQATEVMDFELAARVHKQIEKLKLASAARDAVISDLDSLHGLAIARVKETETVELFPLIRGEWQDHIALDLSETASDLQNLEELLRFRLAASTLVDESPRRDTLEDLALFARWYYSSWREGVWVPFERTDNPPYRKIARALLKLIETPLAR